MGSYRGIGAIGSVRPSQGRGTGIETQILHLFFFPPKEYLQKFPDRESNPGLVGENHLS